MYISMCADLSSEATKPCKKELGEGEGKVLVEEVAEEGYHAVVGPASVHQQQTLQVPAGRREESSSSVIVDHAQMHVHTCIVYTCTAVYTYPVYMYTCIQCMSTIIALLISY